MKEITATRKFADIDIKAIWAYRDLFRMYVRRDVVIQYKQTIFGPLWYLIQPLFTMLVYTFVFGRLAELSTDGAPQSLFYLSGIVFWNYFNECFLISHDVFNQHSNVFGKVYFPRLIVPLSGITSALLKFGIQFLIFVILYLWLIMTSKIGFFLSINIFLLPFIIFFLAFYGMGWGLIVSSLTTKYRDLKFLVQFGIQLVMYATPIIYPLSVASSDYAFFLKLNPLTSIFEAIRFLLLGCGEISWTWLLYSGSFLVIIFMIGIVAFSHAEKNFMDTI